KEIITIYSLTGISGNYNLFLPQQEEIFHIMTQPIAIQYQILEEKHLDLTIYSGQLTELSRRGAKITLDSANHAVKPRYFTNLKLNLCNDAGMGEDIYAKVSERDVDPNSFYIHFTSKIPLLEKIIEKNFGSLEDQA
ncbi:MAG: adenylate/guanylate cyclase domain-containing protein, partial [Microcystaceae cyanobacterium]